MTQVKKLEDLVNFVNKLQEQNVPMDTQIVFTDSDYNYYDIKLDSFLFWSSKNNNSQHILVDTTDY